MNDNLKQAVLMLQRKSRQKFYSSPYHTEIIDRAIDYLLRNLHLNKCPDYLVKNAIANAKKTINRRQQICPTASIKFSAWENSLLTMDSLPNRHSQNRAIEEFRAFKDWFEGIRLTNRDELIIDFLLCGKTEHNLAKYLDISLQQARVAICRSRKRIFQRWQADSNL